MMFSTWRGPLIAVVALLILGGIYLVWSPADEAEAPTPEKEEILLTSVDWEEVDAVEVDWADEYQFRIERSRDGSYQLTSPRSYSTDQERAELLFKSAARLQADRVVATEDEAEPEEFGLAQPKRHITLQMGDGEELMVEIGDPTPVQTGEHTSRYARLADGGDIYLIPGIRLDFYASPLEKWRDRAITDMEEITEASMTASRGTWTARRVDGIYGWELVEPHRAPADNSALDSFVREMRNLRAAEFVTDDPTTEQLEEWDLIDGVNRVALVDSAGETVELIIGSFADDQASEIYVTRTDGDTVYKCVTGFYSAPGFTDPREWIAEKPLAAAPRSEIQSVTTEAEDGSVHRLEREDESWFLTIDGGEKTTIEGTEANQYIDALRNAALRDILWPDEIDDSVERALERPLAMITITFGETGDTRKLEMNLAGPDDDDSEIYATMPDYDTLFVFPTETRELMDMQLTLQSAR